MRFALAVFAAAAVHAYAFTLLTGPGISGVALAVMLLAALGAGFFAARRGALAGLLSLYVGALAYAVFSYLAPPHSTEDAPRDLLDVIGWGFRLGFAILPYAIGAALVGWAGSAARGRVLAWR